MAISLVIDNAGTIVDPMIFPLCDAADAVEELGDTPGGEMWASGRGFYLKLITGSGVVRESVRVLREKSGEDKGGIECLLLLVNFK